MTDPAGKISILEANPPNAVLLYQGSDRWLRVFLPRQRETPGRYIVTLSNDTNGRILAEEVLEVSLAR